MRLTTKYRSAVSGAASYRQYLAQGIRCGAKASSGLFEVKNPGGRLSPEQEDFIDRVNANGGVAYVAYSIDDTIKRLSAHPDAVTLTEAYESLPVQTNLNDPSLPTNRAR